jgi:hypothetical protein
MLILLFFIIEVDFERSVGDQRKDPGKNQDNGDDGEQYSLTGQLAYFCFGDRSILIF